MIFSDFLMDQIFFKVDVPWKCRGTVCRVWRVASLTGTNMDKHDQKDTNTCPLFTSEVPKNGSKNAVSKDPSNKQLEGTPTYETV